MFTLNEKSVKRLNGKKLSTIVENYNFIISDFLMIIMKRCQMMHIIY